MQFQLLGCLNFSIVKLALTLRRLSTKDARVRPLRLWSEKPDRSSAFLPPSVPPPRPPKDSSHPPVQPRISIPRSKPDKRFLQIHSKHREFHSTNEPRRNFCPDPPPAPPSRPPRALFRAFQKARVLKLRRPEAGGQRARPRAICRFR